MALKRLSLKRLALLYLRMREAKVMGSETPQIAVREEDSKEKSLPGTRSIVFEESPTVLSRIFASYNARGIITAQHVCKGWNRYGKLVLSTRQECFPFVGVRRVTGRGRNLDYERRNLCEMVSFKDKFKELDSLPALILAFGSDELTSCILPHMHGVCHLKESLPPEAQICGAICREGMFGSEKGRNWCGSLSGGDGTGGFMFSAGLLKRSDVFVVPFVLRDSDRSSLMDMTKDKDTFSQKFGWPIEQELKCVVLMSLNSRRIGDDDMASLFCEWVDSASEPASHEGPTVAISGGVVHAICEPHNVTGSVVPNSDAEVVGILLGGSGVFASSLLIDGTLQTVPKISEKLTQWKGSELDFWPAKTERFGFVFSCCGRQRGLRYSEYKAIQKTFPFIPMCGLRTVGEYGRNVPERDVVKLSGITDAASRKRSRPPAFGPLDFSTAIAMIGFSKG